MCMCCAGQVLKYIAERAAAYSCEDPHACQGPEEVGSMLWQTLGILVKHGGLLRGVATKGQVRGGLVHLAGWRITNGKACSSILPQRLGTVHTCMPVPKCRPVGSLENLCACLWNATGKLAV